MKLRIYRTSNRYEKPCDEAVEGVFIPQDRRTVGSPEHLSRFKGDPEGARDYWYGEGTNHRVEQGQIVRDLGKRNAWYLEIETIEQLIGLYHKYGDILLTCPFDSNEPALEIRDEEW